jgi:hypothetical protein
MREFRFVLISLALIASGAGYSQAVCGFDQIQAKLMRDPAYRSKLALQEASLRQYILTHPKQKGKEHVLSGPPYTIPIVFHVVTTGGSRGSIYNPTDSQIVATMAYLNAVYNGTYPGTQGAGDLQMQFVLAQRDPNCNPTNGIDHIDGSGIAGYVAGGVNLNTTLGTDEINVKNLDRWDPTQYYNVWVVNMIDGQDGTSGTFIAGFTYFPGGDPNYDGVIILATQTAPGLKTLPHEMGHAFNLYHPFQGSSGNTCPINTDCTTDGDQVCDTDPITEPVNFVCRAGTNPCTSTPYSINTESNYMNYTNCSTLFTPDQDTRMLASAASTARISLSSSLGGTPPGSGTSPCVPKIDFAVSDDEVTESTTATSGCRAYTDHTYYVVIGNSPSAATTATLAVMSGTATQGLKYDITTSGSFSSPSMVLNFPAGSTTSQPFTVRVYDDASVEGTQNLVLGLSVNNGGGNAVAGDGRSSLTITIYDNDSLPYGPTNSTKTLGSSLGLLQSPFAGANAKQKSQILYMASELSAVGIKAGNLVGLSLNISKNSANSFLYTGLTIKMGLTSQGSLYNASTEFPLSDAGFTTVFSSSDSTVNGWNNFSFSTPFAWDGSSNVVVELCYDNGASTSNNDDCEAYTDGSSNSSYVFQSGINCTGSFSSFSLYSGGYKPIAEFIYADPGTAVQTIVNSSQTQYLGPFADVYFYDQTGSKLMAHIQNLSNFNYDCTQVVIDRAGSSATAFWNNNPSNYLMDKTFHVLPTSNNSSGSYNITVYYTQAEVSGWAAATGQNPNNLQLVKAPGQLYLVTPSNPNAAGTVSLGMPTISSLGSNTALTYSFTNGFSGFGAGVVGTALPVTLLSFTGQLQDDHALLNWITSLEVNSKEFVLERSYDDSLFEAIGSVPAAGNSSSPHSYRFEDPDPLQAYSYYRLRLVDLDNRYTYSQVVLIRETSLPAACRVLNNPFTDQIWVSFNQPPASPVISRLFDLTGRLVASWENHPGGSTELELSMTGKRLASGSYILEIQFDNQLYTTRVVKN